MARASRAKKMKRMQPAVTDLVYKWTPATADQGAANSRDQYIDIFRDLSIVNRRGYDQNRMLGITGITIVYPEGGTAANFTLRAHTAGNSWVVQNAHVKGEALFDEMNALVLKDNPSIRGTWAGFKVRLDDHHVAANTLNPLDGDEAAYKAGEWEYSTYVLPQHEVDGAGNPKPALERTAHLVGPNFSDRISLVQAYADSRATVQPDDPNVPAGMSTSFFNILTDSGSQEPELADKIIGDGDAPPYDQDEYPGGATNADCTVLHGIASVSAQTPTTRLGPMSVPCGLLHINGTIIDAPVTIIVHVAPGFYKGVLSSPMGQ